MTISPFLAAINQIAEEKGLDKETVLSTIESAIAAAYRKDYGKAKQIIKVELDPETQAFKPFQIYKVVEEVETPECELDVKSAAKFKKGAKIDDEITIPLPFHADFGRIAAQTAKQVITQRLREAERNVIYNEFKEKEGDVIPAIVQQLEGSTIIVNLGKTSALLLPSDQVRNEHYYVGQRLRTYIKGVEESPRGPKILVSRSDPKLIEKLFTLEVPEIQSGSVLLKAVAREAGERSKVAVISENESIDPVGSCVGQRGTRIQSILAEIGEEKIDIVLWDENPAQFIANALSPARIEEVEIDTKKKHANVYTNDDQLSLAIGRNGQNVRLASKLSEYEIDIIKNSDKVIPKKKTIKKITAKKNNKIEIPKKQVKSAKTAKPKKGKKPKEESGNSK